MICHLCKEDKLSEEFPFEQLTENCHHPLLHCLRCATASVKKNQKCSQCDNSVDEKNEKYQDYLETLEYLYPNLEDDSFEGGSETSSNTPKIYVTTLSGTSATFSFHRNKKIRDLKIEIQNELNISCDKQLLLYQGKALKNTKENMQILELKDYNVLPGSKLQLIIALYAVPEGLDRVVFDLYWGFTEDQTRLRRYGRYGGRYGSIPDYLDASVFLYHGSDYIDVVDFRKRRSDHSGYAVEHSGPAHMDTINQQGHQKINVSIKSIPDNIDNLVFTLSAWRSSDISKYRNPSLKFYDAQFPDKMLCTDEMGHVQYSQAVIMCSLSKKGGQWVAQGVKKPASGNSKGYSPLREAIASHIRRGVI